MKPIKIALAIAALIVLSGFAGLFLWPRSELPPILVFSGAIMFASLGKVYELAKKQQNELPRWKDWH